MDDGDRKAKTAQYNAELKEVRTHQEFQDLYRRASDESLCLVGKRSGVEAFDFQPVRHGYDKRPDWDRLAYLYDDTVSTGEGYVHKLHQHLYFR